MKGKMLLSLYNKVGAHFLIDPDQIERGPDGSPPKWLSTLMEEHHQYMASQPQGSIEDLAKQGRSQRENSLSGLEDVRDPSEDSIIPTMTGSTSTPTPQKGGEEEE